LIPSRRVALVTLVVSLTGATARAYADTRVASEAKARADRAMDRGRYSEALVSYRRAFDEAPSAALLYNMGRAQEKLGHYAEALRSLQAFDASAPAEVKARVPGLGAIMTRLWSRVAAVMVQSSVHGATVFVRGEPRGVTPLARAIPLDAGPTLIEVRAEGYAPYARNVVLTEGKFMSMDAVLIRSSSSASLTTTTGASASSAEPVTSKWWFWTGVGLAVATGAGITVALLNRSTGGGEIDTRQTASALMRF
jgi:hypothetical protein